MTEQSLESRALAMRTGLIAGIDMLLKDATLDPTAHLQRIRTYLAGPVPHREELPVAPRSEPSKLAFRAAMDVWDNCAKDWVMVTDAIRAAYAVDFGAPRAPEPGPE